MLTTDLCADSQPPIRRCISWPSRNGTNNCKTIPITEPKVIVTCEPINSAANSGVITTPSTFDTEAELIASPTLPFAIEVKAIDDCTVDGSTAMKSTPEYNVDVSST